MRRDVLRCAAALASGSVAALALGKATAQTHGIELAAPAEVEREPGANAESAAAQAAPGASAADEVKTLDPYRENPAGQYLTSNQGVRISHTDDSL